MTRTLTTMTWKTKMRGMTITRWARMLGLLLTAAACTTGDDHLRDADPSTADARGSDRGEMRADARLFTADDEAEVRSVEEEYRTAWLANDSAAVMATLSEDAVLMPAGMEPLEGHERIRAFWWPDDGSTTVIESYRITVDEVDGSGNLAYLRGRGFLTFTYRSPDGEESRISSEAVHISVARRGEDGSWRIARRAWSSLPSEE